MLPLLLWAFGLGTSLAQVPSGRPEPAADPSAIIVREVEFRWIGPETVSRQVLEANIQTAKGRPFSRLKLEDDVRSLMRTGYLMQVRVIEVPLADGVKICFELHGRSIVRQVIITGNERFKEDKLRARIKTAAGQQLSERRVHEDARALTEFYQKAGYADARVTGSITMDRDTGKSVVIFKVEEGTRVKVVAIDFTGVKAFSPDVLRKQMKTRKHWLFAWLSEAGRLKLEQFEEDLDQLRRFYHARGYIDMDFVRNEQNNYLGYRLERPKPGQLVVIIDIFEGKQYKVGDVTVSGNKLFPTADIMKKLKMGPNSVYTPAGLAADVKAIRDYYGTKGYLNSDVRAIKSPNVESGCMDIRYEIREGELTYVEKIVIRGNVKTRDKVIRRELAVAPGDVFDTVKVERSRERLQNLGFFSNVATIPEPTDIPNHADLVIQVEEQQTGQVAFGLGFSSIENFFAYTEYTQSNFDLFGWPSFQGGGQKLRLLLRVGFSHQNYVLSFTEPWFLDQRLSLGLDAYREDLQYLSAKYDLALTGGAIRLEKALGEWYRAGWRYGLEDVSLDVKGDASSTLRVETGDRTKSYMVFSLTRDTRDNPFLTLRGDRTVLSAEIAGGPLGGSVDIYKLQAGSSFYFPFFEKQVLLLEGRIGVVDHWDDSKRVPLFDRWFLGGANSIRGFRYRDVGPHDEQNEPVGGKTFWSATAEYGFPIVERIRGAVFFDVGNVYRTAYSFKPGRDPLPGGGTFARQAVNAGAGFGVRLSLPYLGSVRFDIGFPVITDRGNDHGVQVHFNAGYRF